MIRVFFIAAAAILLLAAAKAPSVQYRLDVARTGVKVDMSFRGEADGDTRLTIPEVLASDLAISGATVEAVGPTERLLRHPPGAKVRVRYAVEGPGQELSALGEAVFAAPKGWEATAATVRWGRLPKGWRIVSDLEAAAGRQPLTVANVRRSIFLAGPALQTAERPTAAGTVRAVTPKDDRLGAARLLEIAAPAVGAMRAYWGHGAGPFLVARTAASARWQARYDGFVAPPVSVPDAALQQVLVETYMVDVLETRLGRAPARPAEWLTGGIGKLLTDRALARAGLLTAGDAVGRMADQDRARDALSRGFILALKWDEDIRRKTGGRADLDDVILRMRDHYREFPPGQGPDVVTGLVSAAWVVAKMDLRPDIARYAEGGAPITLPETLFDGCLDARVTVSPGFDSGFDHAGSAAAKAARGVRRGGPAWNSGLRDGMRIDAIDLRPGDMTREIVLTVRPAKGRGRPRTLRYWPYGDNDVEARTLQLAMDLSDEKLAACGRKLGGV
ncbi:hypothetical protein [Phenylobacterium sp.]|uniref:hypothetical protein n=1 Tax=Phenylobacterium sp. TaxID=1871053 RepID=UPI002EDB1A23